MKNSSHWDEYPAMQSCGPLPQVGKRPLRASSKYFQHKIMELPLIYSVRWLYSLFIRLDANFHLKWTTVLNEILDPSLRKGWAYFIDEISFKQHLHDHINQPLEVSLGSIFMSYYILYISDPLVINIMLSRALIPKIQGAWQWQGLVLLIAPITTWRDWWQLEIFRKGRSTFLICFVLIFQCWSGSTGRYINMDYIFLSWAHTAHYFIW